MELFDGLGVNLQNIFLLSNAKSKSICAENITGEKGGACRAEEGTGAQAARELGKGFKISPSVLIPAGKTIVLADIQESGCITHLWMTTVPSHWRHMILKIYWDGETEPSVEVPVGDFFCNGWCVRSNVNALPITVNPAGGFNSYWQMPFRRSAKIEIENLHIDDCILYYQVDYTAAPVPETAAYFHAQFRRTNPTKYAEDYVILDGVHGKGQYVGTYLAWQVNSNGWWGEGEVKFFIDGDQEYPSIASTGTEDYFGGAWNFEQPQGRYCEFSTAYTGLSQVIRPDGLYSANTRFGMYRFHVPDPVRFESDLKVIIQALGWRSHGRYLPLKDDIASVAYWYQSEPHAALPTLPAAQELEVI